MSKNRYIDKLGEYNNTQHSRIKIKPFNVKPSICIDFGVKNNDKNRKFKVGDHVRKSKYRKICVKGYTRNWTEEIFLIKRVKNTVPWTYAREDQW